ncbi:hypothetical protein GCM10009114_27900 [Aliiglaciecola litoralis]|uniref:Uncharacterized protein n=2 Tax=Aliiglaciecola litoralis TaxID=582857 RepID=A0ABP3WZ31_9ALTE
MGCVLFSNHVYSVGCEDLVKQQLDAQTLAAALFKNDKSLFVVITCRQSELPIYTLSYAQLHDASKHKYNVPTSSLSPVNLPINPNGQSKTTGFLVANKSPNNSYTVKLRSRMATGEAIDINYTTQLAVGESVQFKQHDIFVGMVRLPSSS